MKNAHRWITLAALASLGAGCTNALEVTEVKRIGTIVHYEDPLLITTPDTVTAGDPFEVVVRTYGGGCVEKGEVAVQQEGLSVDVTPWDLVREGEGLNCPDVLGMFDHRAVLTLPTARTAEIRFHGREAPADSLLVVTRSVVVLPNG